MTCERSELPQIARLLQRLLGGSSGCRMVDAQMFRSNLIGQASAQISHQCSSRVLVVHSKPTTPIVTGNSRIASGKLGKGFQVIRLTESKELDDVYETR